MCNYFELSPIFRLIDVLSQTLTATQFQSWKQYLAVHLRFGQILSFNCCFYLSDCLPIYLYEFRCHYKKKKFIGLAWGLMNSVMYSIHQFFLLPAHLWCNAALVWNSFLIPYYCISSSTWGWIFMFLRIHLISTINIWKRKKKKNSIRFESKSVYIF